MRKKKQNKRLAPSPVPERTAKFLALLRAVLALGLLAVGLYYEWGSALCTVCLTALLLWYAQGGALRLRRGLPLVAVLTVTGFYLLSALWAVDRGMAVWGFVKLLPLAPFALCCMQLSRGERMTLLEDLPLLGTVMTALTFALQFVPALNRAFSIAGRLGGFFQYPNTFACFLMLCLAVLLCGKTRGWRGWLYGIVLVFGLLQAGSRTVFVLLVPVVIAALLLRREGGRPALLGAMALGTALALGAGALLHVGAGERVAQITPGASTLLGRLLYWKDALPVVLRHPFGLGYLGYYFSQGSFQTGFYTVRWVHNDLLQLMLDVGWLPAALMTAAIVASLFSKETTPTAKLVLLALCAHCMMDFDLSFVSMWLILLLCLDWERGREVSRKPGRAATVCAAALCLLSVWIGAASVFSYNNRPQVALKLYPWDSTAAAAALSDISDGAALEQAADRLLRQNDQLTVAWDAKARGAWSRGDVAAMMEAKQAALSHARYRLEEYVDYFQLLTLAAEQYSAAGDSASMARCVGEMYSLQTMLDALRDQTDPLAWRITEKPELDMPQAYRDYLEAVAGG